MAKDTGSCEGVCTTIYFRFSSFLPCGM